MITHSAGGMYSRSFENRYNCQLTRKFSVAVWKNILWLTSQGCFSYLVWTKTSLPLQIQTICSQMDALGRHTTQLQTQQRLSGAAKLIDAIATAWITSRCSTLQQLTGNAPSKALGCTKKDVLDHYWGISVRCLLNPLGDQGWRFTGWNQVFDEISKFL